MLRSSRTVQALKMDWGRAAASAAAFGLMAAALAALAALQGCGGGSAVSETKPVQTTATPAISPAAGSYQAGQTVTLTDSTPSAVIYYTTNGSTPSSASAQYTAPISLTTAGSVPIQAIAVAPGDTASGVATAVYKINAPPPMTASPTFSPAAGTYVAGQTVTLAETTPAAVIYYTLDGSQPSASSTTYKSPIVLTTAGTITVRAFAQAAGDGPSAVVSAVYTVTAAPVQTALPTFSPAAGTYPIGHSVTIADATAGAVIYYTTNGATPGTSSARYTSPIALSAAGTLTIKAIALAAGATPSAVAAATYTVIAQAQTPAPTFSPAAGTYAVGQSVGLADAAAGAAIYYTTDGSTPSSASNVYSVPIVLSAVGTTTIQALAIASGAAASPVASAVYTVQTTASTEPSYTWQNVQIVGGGFVDGVFFHPRAKGLKYARTDVGGAYRWNDVAGGDTRWVPLLDFIGRFDSGENLGVESLALDPNDASRLYLAVGDYTESYGNNGYILTSADMGKTFTSVALPFKNGANDNGRFAGERLSVDPANGKHLYFGTRLNGLYESVDRGVTWAQVASFPIKGGTGTSNDPGAGVIFEQFLASSGVASGAQAGNTRTVYYGVSDPATGLYVSNDGGHTFAAVAGQPTGYYPNASTFDPSNRYLYVSYGRQANVAANGTTSPCSSSCTSIGPGGINDGQVWRYTLPTAASPSGSWTNITPPLLAGETLAQSVSNHYGYSGVAVDPNHPDTVMVTTIGKYYPPPFDDIFRSRDDGKTWVDYSANASRDSTLSPWVNFGQPTADSGNWINHLAVDPFNPDHMMYGDGQTIWQTLDATAVDGPAPGATQVTEGNKTSWSIGALGVEETVILGLASPPSGPAHLLSVMYDLGGFTHTTLTQSLKAQSNPQLTNGTSIDFAGQAPLNVARAGSNTVALGSGTATQLEAFSSDGGLTWTPSGSLPINPSTGSAITVGNGTIAVSANGAVLLWQPADAGTPPNYSTDHGATWHASTGAPAQINQGYNLNLVAADRVNPKKFYLFSPQLSSGSDGITTVYVSTNGGQSFSIASRISNRYDSGFFVSPAAEGDLWVTSYTGLYHSTDSGATFSAVLAGPNESYAMGFGAAAPGLNYPAIYLIGTLAADSSCAAPSDTADGFSKSTQCVYRSLDEGKTFLRINDFAHQYANANVIVGDPRIFGRVYIGTPGRGIIEGDSPK